MPLSFETVNQGVIAFGFFNIDSDMLLLDKYFMFASDFCAWVIEWSKDSGDKDQESSKEIFIIDETENIGNLMGAISGVVFTGFIGEVYKKYPFPKEPDEFRQKTDGFKNREVVEGIIKDFGVKKMVEIKISKAKETISIGDYTFSKKQFHEVLSYVWRGGMPKWKDEQRPEYVDTMMKEILISKHWLFKAEVPVDK